MACRKPPIRLWIGIMIFMTTLTNYMMRSNMSVSIIDMVERKSKNFTPPCKRDELPRNTSANSTTPAKHRYQGDERYNWDETQIGHIMGAYFYGYIATSIPGGALAELIGPWHVIMWSSLVSAILTGLTPLSATLGPSGVIVNRFFVGLLGGVVYPAINVIIAKWAPPKEKGKFMTAMMGNTLGTVIAFTMVGFVTAEFGWKWGFYVLVIVMGVYLVLFGIIVSDSPEKHYWISEEEQKFIKEAQENHVSNKKKVAPYLKILKSGPFWVTTTAQFGNLWALNLILTYAPKFMVETLGFNIKASVGLASLPYLSRLFCSSIFGLVGDRMRKKEIMSVTKMRKFFIIFSHLLPAACMFLIRAAGCNHVGVISLLVLNQGFNAAVVGYQLLFETAMLILWISSSVTVLLARFYSKFRVSHLVNPQDLAPNFAGSVYGIMNTVAMTTGIFVPAITGALNTEYKRELAASTIIFTIGGVATAFCGIIFIIFGQAKVQSWNDIPEDGEDEKAGKSQGQKTD